MAHDTSRICECSIQHATQLQRWQIYNEIKKDFIELSKNRYGKFVMLKIIKYGEKEHRLGILKVRFLIFYDFCFKFKCLINSMV